jgi:transcriptional regulator with XRE-family HTH domain
VRLRGRGLTLSQIARALGCDRSTVRRMLKEAAAPVPPVRCPACGAAVFHPGSGIRPAPTFCLPCLSQRPQAPLGERLRAHRLAAGLTLARLGRRAGLSFGLLGSIELGRRDASPEAVRKLARALGVTLGRLQPSR